MENLLLDIGGTFIKYGHSDENGFFIEGSASQQPFDSSAGREEILAAFETVVKKTGASGRAFFCMPGPFDFETGTCWMKQKFTGLYGYPLNPFFRSLGLECSWIHDSTAFMLGEFSDGTVKGYCRPAGIILGTGFGFALMKDSKVLVSPNQRPVISLWNRSFREGTVETYVSRKAIRSHYRDGSLDVKEIADLARGGDAGALEVMQAIGTDIADILELYLRDDDYDSLVLGGQIARSASLFIDILGRRLSKPVFQAAHPDDAALRGLSYVSRRGKGNCVRVIDYTDSPEKDLKELEL